jgi:eukaryotic-like serine/threonine-protein kinase
MGLLMIRLTPGILFAGLLVLSGCQALKVPRAQLADDAAWTHAGGGPERSNSVEDVIPGLRQRWRYYGGAGFGPGGPLIAGRFVVVPNRRGEVHLVDAITGRGRGMARFGDAIEGAPALDGAVLFIPIATGNHGIRAYDVATGRQRWRGNTGPVEASVLASGGLVFLSMHRGSVVALDGHDGSEVWRFDPERPVERTAASVRHGDLIISPDGSGRVIALGRHDGTLKWKAEVGAPVRSSPVVAGGTIVLTTTEGTVHALDGSTGMERWRRQAADPGVELTSPAVRDTLLAVAGSDRTVRLLHLDNGLELWRRDVGSVVTAAPLLALDAVAVGTHGEELLVLVIDTGEVRERLKVRGRVRSAMAFRAGLLVLQTDLRQVYAFEVTASVE